MNFDGPARTLQIHRLASCSAQSKAEPLPCEGGIPLHLLRLVSPSLPVGAFSYSRGLEWAVHAGWVQNHFAARDWILGTLENVFATLDGALFWRLVNALYAEDHTRFAYVNAWLAAGRESKEMQLEDQRMGEALMALLEELHVPAAQRYAGSGLTFPAGFAIAAHHWQLSPVPALKGLMWTVVEAQVAAAIRLVPLGHVAGQRVLIDAVPVIERGVTLASTIDDDEVGNLSVAQAMASAWHETEYSRLFRS